MDVALREFNPMERPWCREMALAPDEVHWHGPNTETHLGVNVLTIGRAVFDRKYVCSVSCHV